VRQSITVAEGIPPELVTLAHDPQTSGGLLAAVDPGRIDAVEADLDGRGVPYWRIGRVEAGEPAVVLG
jgi:selenide,water dikinase